jgi:hypothetical protein
MVSCAYSCVLAVLMVAHTWITIPHLAVLSFLLLHQTLLTYRPDPIMCTEVELPEDKLKAGMKERLVASLVATHEQTEQKVDEIYR